MARRRRKARVIKPVEVEEEVLEEELGDEFDEEGAEEETVQTKPKTRRHRKVVEPEPEEDEDYEEEEEEVKPKPASRRRKKKVVEPEPEPEETFSSADLFDAIMDGLDEGQSVVITASGDDEWVLSASTAKTVAPATTLLKGAAYYKEVRSEEFEEHYQMWKDLTVAEKKSRAKKVKATWEPHEDSRVEVMRITAAVRKQLGIEKYKPQYRSRAARAAIRG